MKTTKRDFRASRQLKLHKRAVDCLDMIVNCDNHYANARDYLNRYNAANWMDMIRIVNNRGDLESHVNKYAAIKQRLTRYYVDIMARINEVAIEYLEGKNIEVNENY